MSDCIHAGINMPPCRCCMDDFAHIRYNKLISRMIAVDTLLSLPDEDLVIMDSNKWESKGYYTAEGVWYWTSYKDSGEIDNVTHWRYDNG